MLHRLVVGGKMVTAFEFWQMTPGQVWWLVEDMMPQSVIQKPKELKQLYDEVKARQAKEKAAQDD